MNNRDAHIASVAGAIFCLCWSGVIAWHVTNALKTEEIFRFSKIPLGKSAFIRKKDNPGQFWYAVVMGYFLSAVFLIAAVLAFIAGFFPNLLHYLPD